MPNLSSGWPNLAVSAAMRMWQAMASSHPPPNAKPLTAAITGLGQDSMRENAACPVRAGHERLGASAGDEHARHVVAALHERHRLIQLGDGLVVERIELVGAIDANGRHAIVDVEGEILEGHG